MLLQGKPLICISTDADSKSDPKKRVLNNNLVYARADLYFLQHRGSPPDPRWQ